MQKWTSRNGAAAGALTATIIGLLTVLAFSQPVQPPQKQYSLNGLSPGDLQIIGKGLGMLPYGEVAGLMSRLQAQVIAQDSVKPPVAKPTDANGNPVSEPKPNE